MLRYFCFLAAILGVRSGSAPFVRPCKPEDTACILASAQAVIPILAPGIPDLGVPSLDPLQLKLVNSENSGLKLTLTDSAVTGLRDCTIEDTRLRLGASKVNLDASVRCSVVLRGTYKLRGAILLLPIRGDGKVTIKIRDIVISANTTLNTVPGKDGQEHWHVNKWKHSFDVRTKVSFHFENLFDGNKALAEPVEKLINEQWRIVVTEVAPPIVHSITERVVQAVDAFFAAVPASELYVA